MGYILYNRSVSQFGLFAPEKHYGHSHSYGYRRIGPKISKTWGR
jgi:cbb3-type cytochrome oxidase cytochrome c subunit